MRYFSLLLVTFLCIHSYSYAQVKKTYYDNGNLKSVGESKGWDKVGYWERYYENGKLESKGEYKDGDKIGYWEEYYENGKLKYKGEYKDDDMIGYWELYHENGTIYCKLEYDKEERLIGHNEIYNNEGILIYEANWLDDDKRTTGDNRIGNLKTYYDSGKLQKKGKILETKNSYVVAIGKWEYYYENGNLRKKVTYSDEKDLIDWWITSFDEDEEDIRKRKNSATEDGFPIYLEQYYENGNLHAKRSFNKGLRFIGNYETYYENGKLGNKGRLGEGKYNTGAYVGKWRICFDYGGEAICGEANYGSNRKGKTKTVPYKGYYENGTLGIKGAVKGKKLDGDVKFYNSEGTLAMEGVYKKGKKYGMWKVLRGYTYIENTPLGQAVPHIAEDLGIEGSLYFYINYDNDGKIEKVQYKTGELLYEKKNSKVTYYYKNGQIYSTGYVDSKYNPMPDSKWKVYNKDGSLDFTVGGF